MVVDAPVQMYALLFVPGNPERNLFSARKDDGLKLYSRKVLIQEYCKDLLPEYCRFVQGVVDSEDLPLNISRETVQSNRIMAQLKKLVTSKVISALEELAQKETEAYAKFWGAYGPFIKQGVAIEQAEPESLYPLLRFHTTAKPDELSSLDDYVHRMQLDQKHIYYILGDDKHSVLYSPHLDVVRRYNYEVLLLTDPLDSFMLVRLNKYRDYPLTNVATADLELPASEAEESAEAAPALSKEDYGSLVERFKAQLGARVTGVRMTARLSDSPARLVDPEGTLNQEMQRVYRLLNKDFEVPQKVLELNPRHPILLRFKDVPEDSPLSALVIEQIYEDALLIEGLHPEPASMVSRIQKLIESALE
jgi:molecular chaperone HtpG